MKIKITDTEVSSDANISRSTLNNWKIRHPSVVESLKIAVIAKKLIDSSVIENLIKKNKKESYVKY